MKLEQMIKSTKITNSKVDPIYIREILKNARELKGLNSNQVSALLDIEDSNLEAELFETASFVKNEIYGKRIVLFAPMYISNKCNNDCLYCAFRKSNNELIRSQLTQEEIKIEVKSLINLGHKRLLVVGGEEGTKKELDYVIKSIETVYSVKTERGNIRRVNVNIAPLSVEDFKRLKDVHIGTYQCFQETYDEEIYKKIHPKGPKSNFLYRLYSIDRAFQAGIEDVGIGVLFGLAPWKKEVLSLMKHIEYLEQTYGFGPHTISVPRIEPAFGADYSKNPLHPVDDKSFLKIIAILRLAIPYTGIILSTRESIHTRQLCLNLGISQMSAGSKTDPGGYNLSNEIKINHTEKEQFTIGDTRTLKDVVKDLVNSNHIPSFCTGCYRQGRVGKDFMDLAKTGLIKKHCLTNAMSTFYEYITDFGDEELKKTGHEMIRKMIDEDVSSDKMKSYILNVFNSIEDGKRDLYL